MEYQPPEAFVWKYCAICGEELLTAHDGQSSRPHCVRCRRFYYENPTPAVCCFVRRNQDELLFAQRAVQPCYGEWCVPGGFVELGETTEEAALRELAEETNLRGANPRLFGVSTQQSRVSGAVMVLGYAIDVWEGEDEMAPDSDALSLRFAGPAERPPLAFQAHRELLALYDALQKA